MPFAIVACDDDCVIIDLKASRLWKRFKLYGH